MSMILPDENAGGMALLLISPPHDHDHFMANEAQTSMEQDSEDYLSFVSPNAEQE
jgi:hypothetical protein